MFLPTIEDPSYERSAIGEVEQQLVEIDDALKGLRNLVQKVHTMKSVIYNFREESDDTNKTSNRNEHEGDNFRTPTYDALDGESNMP